MSRWVASGYSHVGNVRTNNEDNLLLCGKRRSDTAQNIWKTAPLHGVGDAVFAVCDGMGGESHGEWASLVAVESLFPSVFEKKIDVTERLQQANDSICQQIKARGQRIGSTCVTLVLDGNQFEVTNIGDSRAYLFRNQTLTQLSQDHTEYQRKLNMGISPQRLRHDNRSKHVLTQHLGIFPEELCIQPYCTGSMLSLKGDCVVLCSDGLTDMVSDEEISVILQKQKTVAERCDDLIELALEKGGLDNITVLLVENLGM